MSGNVDALVQTLRRRRGIDLRDYSEDTFAQGLRARLAATGARDAAAYLEVLEQDEREIDALVSAVLVQVTAFFRDEPVFLALRDTVAPALLPAQGPLRAWVIGCATGEEAWSLASVLEQACGPRFHILATDVDAAALTTARAACYADRVIPHEHRARVTFARHDIAGPRLAPKEAIIATYDLVLLRNVLIYFRPGLQERILRRLATVVRPGGALVLGPCEWLSEEARRGFLPWPGLDARLKIFHAVRAPA